MSCSKPFQGIASFLKSPICDLSREIGIYGIPFDNATSFRPGARFGPNAIRQASMMLTDGEHPLFGVDPYTRVTDMGDIPVSSDPSKCVADIEAALSFSPFIQPGKRIMAMGGDHLVTLGILRALEAIHGPIAVIHWDSHSDVWNSAFGEKLGHGTWLRAAIEEVLISPYNSTSIGVRSPTDKETAKWFGDQGGKTFSARESTKLGVDSLVGQILNRVGDLPTYITFDIDALDPAYAPGTGTPEIAGFSTMFALEAIEKLAGCNLIGMDVVEVSPPYDHSEITSLAAATLLWTFCCG